MVRIGNATFTGMLFLLGVSGALAEETVWPLIEFEELSTDGRVTDIVPLDDGSGRLCVVRQDGNIEILAGNAAGDGPAIPVVGTSFLNINGQVGSFSENGLWGMAVPPDFSEKRHFYVFYSRTPDNASVLSRFDLESGDDSADPSSELVLLEIPVDSQTRRHRGGQIRFGPDGLLYVAVGDHLLRETANDTHSLKGSILRLDVEGVDSSASGLIPSSNPYVDGEAGAPEVLHKGLRNPWRFSFDRADGRMFMTDVGENSREEINVVEPFDLSVSMNFGWPRWEGTLLVDEDVSVLAPVAPAAELRHRDGNCGIIGGLVYRGPEPAWNGCYFFADLCGPSVWVMQELESGYVKRRVTDANFTIQCFGRDEAGNLYAGGYGLSRIVPARECAEPEVPMNYFILEESQVTVSGVRSPTIDSWTTFTTDGSLPESDGARIEEDDVLVFESDVVLRLRAFHATLLPSSVVEKLIDVILQRPGSQPESGTLAERVPIMLTHPNPDAVIRYELDGRTPGPASPVFDPTAPIMPVGDRLRVKAFAEVPGGEMSFVSDLSFNFEVVVDGLKSFYRAGELLDISSRTPGAMLRFTINGEFPDSSSPLWEDPVLPPTPGTLLRVKGFSPEYSESDLASSRVSYVDPVWGTLSQVSPQPDWSNLEDYAVDAAGNYYWVESGRIWRDIGDGRELLLSKTVPVSGFRFARVACDEGGNLFAAWRDIVNSSLKHYIYYLPGPDYEEGSLRVSEVIPGDVTDLVVDGSGGVLISAGAQIYRFDPSTNVLSSAGFLPVGGGSLWPNRAFLSDDDRQFAISTDGHRVWCVDDGSATPVVGNAVDAGYLLDGPDLAARVESVSSATPVAGGWCVIDDYRLRIVSHSGVIRTVTGPELGEEGSLLKSDMLGSLGYRDLKLGANGTLYARERYGNKLLKVQLVDVDGDGVSDAVEHEMGKPFEVGVDDRYRDDDTDGSSNAVEAWFGTAADSSHEQPVGSKVRRLDTGRIAFRQAFGGTGSPVVGFSRDLDSWFRHGTSPREDGTGWVFDHSIAPGDDAVFLRLYEAVDAP